MDIDNMLEKREELLRLDYENIWHPFTPLQGQKQPTLIEKAKGVYLYTADGRKIIDAVSSWWVSIHGHGNEHIARAVADQALNMEHVIFAGFTHRPAIQLSKNILSILPNNQEKVFFSDNGSTAVEVAIKIAFQYWHNLDSPKSRVIAIEGAYHGDTFGAMSIGERGSFNIPFEPFLFDVDFIPFPNEKNANEVIRQFTRFVEAGDVSSFIFEPLIQGAGGMRTYPAHILDKLIDIAKQLDILCIADEVMTGFGRTGKLFATDYLSNKPDLYCLSKGLTGGTMPMGLTSASTKVVNAFNTDEVTKTFFHGHSYTGNPIACAAANASFDLLQVKSFQENIDRINQSHQIFAKQVEVRTSVRDVRVLGTVIAMELELGETSYNNSKRNFIYQFFLEKDILMRPLGNIIYILPPFVITSDELQIVYSSILELCEILEK